MSKKWIFLATFLMAAFFFLYKYAGRQVSALSDVCISLIVTPVLYAQNALLKPITSSISLSDRISMHHKIKQLERENHRLIEELVMLRGALQFIDDTTELVQYSNRYTHDEKHLAQVILRVFDCCGHYFLVDKGSCHGIEKDMVAVYKNALIGRVDTVYPYWSKVVLVTDPRCSVAAFCSHSKAHGICEGNAERETIALNHVNHLDRLQLDDYVISSGQGTLFPRGFGIGRVKEYVNKGLFYTVQVKPLISFDTIDYCYLFKKGTE